MKVPHFFRRRWKNRKQEFTRQDISCCTPNSTHSLVPACVYHTRLVNLYGNSANSFYIRTLFFSAIISDLSLPIPIDPATVDRNNVSLSLHTVNSSLIAYFIMLFTRLLIKPPQKLFYKTSSIILKNRSIILILILHFDAWSMMM